MHLHVLHMEWFCGNFIHLTLRFVHNWNFDNELNKVESKNFDKIYLLITIVIT